MELSRNEFEHVYALSNKSFSTSLAPKVRCPFTVGNSLLQCNSCFHSEDGFKPANLKSFQLHAANIHCNPQLGPGQPLPDRYSEWYPQASYASCKHPGCPYRIIFTNKRFANYLQQHEANCLHNPESIRANTAQLEQVLQPFNRSKNRRSQARDYFATTCPHHPNDPSPHPLCSSRTNRTGIATRAKHRTGTAHHPNDPSPHPLCSSRTYRTGIATRAKHRTGTAHRKRRGASRNQPN
jgi:hypothetical protein